MNKTKIEWVKNPDGTQGYTLNPVKGKCPMACSYCYARKMYDRFKWNPEVRYDPMVLNNVRRKLHFSEGYRIFVGSTMELFNEKWIKPWWLWEILAFCAKFPQHTFQFLTKCPEKLGYYEFPDNCWVGVTATNNRMFHDALAYLEQIKATVRYISIEPCLERILSDFGSIPRDILDWLIIGAQTKPYRPPAIQDVEEIVRACDKAGVPVFLKDNLIPLLNQHRVWEWEWAISPNGKLRQEMPNG